jgi:hypothetical protein
MQCNMRLLLDCGLWLYKLVRASLSTRIFPLGRLSPDFPWFLGRLKGKWSFLLCIQHIAKLCIVDIACVAIVWF